MERQEEIKQLLRHLLAKTDDAINDNQYSTDEFKIIKSSKEIVSISTDIQKYLNELEEIRNSQNHN